MCLRQSPHRAIDREGASSRARCHFRLDRGGFPRPSVSVPRLAVPRRNHKSRSCFGSLVLMAKRVPMLVVLALTFPFASQAEPNLRADSSSQIEQNRLADADHLSRMQDKAMVQRWARLELLTRVKEKTRDYYLHAVPNDYRYLRPWAHLFLQRLASQFRTRFGRPLRVTSMLRTVSYQRSLARRNGNAAPSTGPKASVHLTGACLDISKKGMTRSQQSWVRNVLASLHAKK